MVTFATAGQRPLFSDWLVAVDAARFLTSPTAWWRSEVLAWVLMPDHWHGLVRLGDGDELSRRIGWVKSETARRLRKAHPEIRSVWAKAFEARALHTDEDLRDVARGVITRPLRAGLVDRVGAYPLWNAVWLGGTARSPETDPGIGRDEDAAALVHGAREDGGYGTVVRRPRRAAADPAPPPSNARRSRP